MIFNPGKTLTVGQVVHLTNIAYQNAFTRRNKTVYIKETLNRLALLNEGECLPSFTIYEEEFEDVQNAVSSLSIAMHCPSRLLRSSLPETGKIIFSILYVPEC